MRFRNKKGAIRYNENTKKFYASIPPARQDKDKKRIYLGSFETLEKAQKAINLALKSRDRGQIYTISEWLKAWIERSINLKSDSTISLHKRMSKNINYYIGSIKLGDLVTSDIESMYSKLAANKAKTTIHLIHRILNAALNKAVQDCLIQSNPAKGAKRPRLEPRLFAWLPKEEDLPRLREAITQTTKYKFPLLFGLLAGLRPGEALAVKWSDIDFNIGTLKVNRQVVRVDNCIVEKELKTTSSYRTVILAPQIMQELNKIPLNKRDGYIVKRYYQKPELVRYCLKNICLKIGIKTLSPHKLRHLTATILIKEKVSPELVSQFLGHSNVKTTLEIYAHVMPTMQLEARNILAQI